jgi:TonB-dependent SusC/RagA subfamily outer membrane receptor
VTRARLFGFYYRFLTLIHTTPGSSMKRISLVLAVFALSACAGDRLTGPAAQEAVAGYQVRSVSASKTPLIFLDGKEITSLDAKELDSRTIESVEVLKGQKALETYGARAANGVIFIASKK